MSHWQSGSGRSNRRNRGGSAAAPPPYPDVVVALPADPAHAQLIDLVATYVNKVGYRRGGAPCREDLRRMLRAGAGHNDGLSEC